MTGYRLIKTERLRKGTFRQYVKFGTEGKEFDYYGIRFALSWPTAKAPGYFIGGGEETYNEAIFAPASGRGVIRILCEYEHNDLSLDSFFTELTDHMMTHLAETVYADIKGDPQKENFRNAFYSFLDRKKLRNLSVEKAPYDDFILRIGVVKSFDEAGDLLIDKGSPLFGEVQGISRLDLADPDVEVKFFRLNALSFLLSGFQKYGARPILDLKEIRVKGRGGSDGWML